MRGGAGGGAGHQGGDHPGSRHPLSHTASLHLVRQTNSRAILHISYQLFTNFHHTNNIWPSYSLTPITRSHLSIKSQKWSEHVIDMSIVG